MLNLSLARSIRLNATDSHKLVIMYVYRPIPNIVRYPRCGPLFFCLSLASMIWPFNDLALFIHTKHMRIFMNQAISKAHNATNIINKFCKHMTFHEAMQTMRKTDGKKTRELKDEKQQCFKHKPNVENDYNIYGT